MNTVALVPEMLRWFIFLLMLVVTADVRAAAPPGATVLDPSILWDPICADSAAVSPDGKWIAYVSKGAIWTCSVTAGPPKKLVDLPSTITDFLTRPENQEARDKFAFVAPHPGLQPLPHLRGQIQQFFGLDWTLQQDGLTYTLHRNTEDPRVRAYEVKFVSREGKVTNVASIERDWPLTPDSFTSFHVTADKKHVVASSFGVPLIWNATTNKPQATCFDYLRPSSTSDRFLGVEIDTRELVLVDNKFQVLKRFSVTFNQRRRCDLFWSPNEKLAVCRSFLEHPSDEWEGFRIDLVSDEVRKLEVGLQSDRFVFPAKGDEIIRIGRSITPRGGYADGSNGTFIELILTGNEAPRTLVQFVRAPLATDNYRNHRWYPPVVANSEGTLFAIALPRPDDKKRGYHFHLVDRNENQWPLQPVNESIYYTPYLPIAFANNDQTLVARSADQLFSIPTAAIQEGKENGHEE